jgi:hypothetical protein
MMGDSEVDNLRTVRSENHVVGREVSMYNPGRLYRGERL